MATPLEAGAIPARIGTVVRARRDKDGKYCGRCTVAVVSQDDNQTNQQLGGTAEVIWSDPAPQPLSPPPPPPPSLLLLDRTAPQRFLVAPLLGSSFRENKGKGGGNPQKRVEEMKESTVPLDELCPLLDFEGPAVDGSLDENASVAEWKTRGDTLFKLRDHSVAVPYYEMALQQSSQVQIGGTVILLLPLRNKSTSTSKSNSNPNEVVRIDEKSLMIVVAEVDCIDYDDDDDNDDNVNSNGGTTRKATIDVTVVDSQDEMIIKGDKVILAVSPGKADLQARILLNLGRCLLQLAEFDNEISLARPLAYRERACLAFSLVLALASTTSDDNRPCGDANGSNLPQDHTGPATMRNHLISALLLRSQAHSTTGRLKAAVADANRLLHEAPTSKQAKKWRKTLDEQLLQERKSNKRLVKSMSRWVQTAMQTSTDEDDGPSNHSKTVSPNDTVSPRQRKEGAEEHPQGHRERQQSNLPFSQALVVVFLALVAQRIIYRWIVS